MKKIWFVLLTFLFIICIQNVNALNRSDVYMECIYEDGSTITYNKNQFYRSYSNYGTKIESSTMTSIDLFLSKGKTFITDNKVSCPDVLSKHNTTVEDVNYSFYYFRNELLSAKDVTEILHETFDEVNIFQSFIAGISRGLPPTRTYKLVSEDIQLTSNITKNICEYVNEKEQILGENQYISILKTNDNQILVAGDEVITSVNSSTSQLFNTCPKDIYINNPGYYIVFNKTNVTPEYGDARYEITTSEDGNHKNHYKYVENIIRDETSEGINICEKMPNTVKVIQVLIRIAQVTIPIIIVIMTMLDYLKVITSTGLDGDGNQTIGVNSKKANKKFIRRLIFAAVFIFLPTIVNIILNLLYNSGLIKVSDINCFLI